MIHILYAVLLALPASAAVNSPLEADFPAGYWEREGLTYGSAATSYSITLAAKEPAAIRAKIEDLMKSAGATLTGFSDQTPYLPAQKAAAYYPGMAASARPAYSLTHKLDSAKAGEIARRVADMARLTSYQTQTPYGTAQQRELDDKIEWIEREQKQSAGSLKTMPVSRALMESRLKLLKQNRENIKASEGTATIIVQILFDEAEKADEATVSGKVRQQKSR